MSRDVRDYRAAFSRCVDLAEEWQAMQRPMMQQCGVKLADALAGPDDEPAPEPIGWAHPATMIGRK